MPLNKERIRDLIKLAESKKKDEVLDKLRAEVDEERKILEQEKSKLSSARFQLDSDRKERDENLGLLAKIRDNKAYMDPKDHEQAEEQMIAEMDTLEKKIEDDLKTVSDLEASSLRRSARVNVLLEQQRKREHPGQESERYPALSKLVLERCRPEIARAFEDCGKFESILQTYGDDKKKIYLKSKIVAGNLRRLQLLTSDKTPHENIVLRQCFRVVVGVVKRTPCLRTLRIEALDLSFGTDLKVSDWENYVNSARGDLAGHTGKLEAAAKPKEPEPEPEEKSDEPELDTKMMAELLGSGVIQKVKDKRLALYGGRPIQAYEKFCEDVLCLKEARWFRSFRDGEEIVQLTQSIRNGGVDVLLVWTQWNAHSTMMTAVKEAKARNVPIAYCNSSSKEELCRQLMKAFEPAARPEVTK